MQKNRTGPRSDRKPQPSLSATTAPADRLQIFIGLDSRQPLAHTVAYSSLIHHASRPVSVTPLLLRQLPISRRGLTEFTFSRYLVPWLMGYRGVGLFIDPDVVVVGDVWDILKHIGGDALYVVNHAERFEWPSVMLFDCARCATLTPELIESGAPQLLDWAESIGELPAEWNHLVGYNAPNPQAKIVHFTAGIPHFPETRHLAGGEWRDAWRNALRTALHSVSWQELMGDSAHRELVHNAHAER